MGSFLVVANQTSGGEALGAHLRRVIASDPDARFVVLVPVATPAPADIGGAMGVMSGIAVIDPVVQDQLRDVARERLHRILVWFRDAGVEADGAVVGDPMTAMEAAMDTQHFDEIIVSTPPARLSQWMRRDLVRRATRRFAVPITTVMAADTAPTPDVAETVAAVAAPAAAGPATISPSTTMATERQAVMADSVYKIIELVGTSREGWEQAAAAAIAKAGETLRDLRVAEVSELDMVIDEGAVVAYRAKVKVSFKYEGEA